jgi:hypothetical protein
VFSEFRAGKEGEGERIVWELRSVVPLGSVERYALHDSLPLWNVKTLNAAFKIQFAAHAAMSTSNGDVWKSKESWLSGGVVGM